MSATTSNLRVYVHFKEPTVFAGEDVQCTITFKNIDHSPSTPRASNTPRQAQQSSVTSKNPPANQRNQQSSSSREAPPTKINPVPRTSVSQNRTDAPPLNVVDSVTRHNPHAQANGGINIADSAPARRKHSRTLSIISLGSEAGSDKSRSTSLTRGPSRPGQHSRAVSPAQIQTTSLQRTSSGRSPSLVAGGNATVTPSPLSGNTATSSPSQSAHPAAGQRRHSRHLSEAGSGDRPAVQGRSPSNRAPSSFKFPSSLQDPDSQASKPSTRDPSPIVERSRSSSVSTRKPLPRSPDAQNEKAEYVAPLSKVFSISSQNGTPRSSMDFYNGSNNSNETLFSEYSTQPSSRLLTNPFSRNTIQNTTKAKVTSVENLMMGYVQISGSFTLDSSLVNPGPFEDVKRRAVVGGRGGGGVVGIDRPQSDKGLLSSFGWSSIGESLGGLLGGGELSSIKEMKSTASSKSIPLITTPKSILFVDLKLNPGESRSYSYSFALPRGLPPSHRGRAMKVNYHLIIGTQRPSSGRTQQQMRQVDVPFRVFGGVNARGEDFGHDLMAPYVILKDQAKTVALSRSPSPNPSTMGFQQPPDEEASQSSHSEFQNYVERLLDKPRQGSGQALISPTTEIDAETPILPSITRTLSSGALPLTTRALIDATLRRSSFYHAYQHTNSGNSSDNPAQSSTRFNIARSSVPVATIILSRSALRLGDLLTVLLDFSKSPLPCYAFEATLESVETIDPSLAIRSKQSVERATRRVWARTVQSALWARRSTFSFQVPVHATPGFGTSGVGLEWSVRVELVVRREELDELAYGEDEEDDGEDEEDNDEDSVATDDDVPPAPLRTASQRQRQEQRERERQRQMQSQPRRPVGRANTKNPSTSSPATAATPTTPHQQQDLEISASATAKTTHLLREAHADDRGTLFTAVETLHCESFEVAMPIRVFGATLEGEDGGTSGTEGFVV